MGQQAQENGKRIILHIEILGRLKRSLIIITQ